jgi:hypothetical protein
MRSVSQTIQALSFGVLFICDSLEYMQGIIPMEPCGFGYWVVSSLQIPLAIIFTALILYRKESCQHQTINQQVLNIPQ